MTYECDFSDVRGNRDAIAAIVEATCTRSHVLLVGPRGIGTTMLARRAPTILEPTASDLNWATIEYTAMGLLGAPTPPFRAPHHTISEAALVGKWHRVHRVTCPTQRAIVPPHRCNCADDRGQPGDRVSRPGEVMLARFGVLYLDELIDFSRSAIGALGQHLRTAPFRLQPLVIASVTPCPCGYLGSDAKVCACTPEMVARHTARIEAYEKILGGFVRVRVDAALLADLRKGGNGPASAWIRDRLGEVHESPQLDDLTRDIRQGTPPAESDWIAGWRAWVYQDERPRLASMAVGWDAAAHVNENSAVKPIASEAAEQYRRHHATREVAS